MSSRHHMVLHWPRDNSNFSLRGWGFFNIKTKFIHASLSCRLVISWFLRRKFRSPHTLGWYNSNKTVNTIIAITGNLGPWLLPQICKLDKTQFKWKLISTELTQVQGGPGCLCLLSKQGGRSNFCRFYNFFAFYLQSTRINWTKFIFIHIISQLYKIKYYD